MELVLGIDDAGRGPVIGPMILAGVLIEPSMERELKELGVRDSKQLTDKRREFLAEKIREKAIAFEFEVIYPNEIDGSNKDGIDLNKLEAIKAASIINKINKGFKKIKVIIDCPSVSILKWQDYLKTKIDDLSNLEVVCEHKADQNHVSVSAASIIAKSVREKEMDKLKSKYGKEIGSGYCSDPLTCRFLEENLQKFDGDGIFRKTWETWRRACQSSSQTKLKFN